MTKNTSPTSNEDTQMQEIQECCTVLANFISSMPVCNQGSAVVIICFAAIMTGANHNYFKAKGIAAEVVDEIRKAIEEQYNKKGDKDVPSDRINNI